ncbi:hypothetical protein [Acidithiobacillus sp.]|uniref:hypothetical protein n=1 Tax=Acidithiobacillus sp. TaxID=1872118 RepID=UPI003D044B5F
MNAFAFIYLFRILVLPLARLTGAALGLLLGGVLIAIAAVFNWMARKTAARKGLVSPGLSTFAVWLSVLGWPVAALTGQGRAGLFVLVALFAWWLMSVALFPKVSALVDRRVLLPLLRALRVDKIADRLIGLLQRRRTRAQAQGVID